MSEIKNKHVDDIDAVDIALAKEENPEDIEDISDIIEAAATQKIQSKTRRAYEKSKLENEYQEVNDYEKDIYKNDIAVKYFLFGLIFSFFAFIFYKFYKTKKEEAAKNVWKTP